jgi:hypothetical protein
MKNKVKEKSIAYNFSFVHPPLPISCEAVQTGKVYSFLTPHPVHIMTEVRDFIAALARTGKGMKEIKILADRAYGIKSLKRTQIYQIIKEVKEGKTLLTSGIPTRKKPSELVTLSLLSPPPLKRTAAKHFEDLL